MAAFEVSSELQGEIPVLGVKGYYEKPAGMKVTEEAGKHFQAGRVFLILDLAKCDVLSSPGVSTIVEIAIDVMDQYSGKLIICGLDKLKEKVLKLVGIQTLAEVTPTLPEALEFARKLRGS